MNDQNHPQLRIQTRLLPYIEIGASSGVQSVRPVTRRAGKGMLDAIMDGSEAHSSFCWAWLFCWKIWAYHSLPIGGLCLS